LAEKNKIMNLSTLRAPKAANSNKKRVGRGMGSGMGKTSTRGHKGQRSRSGSRMMRGFEGGQMPLHRRLPKRGFNNIFRTEYVVVNLDRIADLGAKDITPEVLHKAGIIKSASALVKVLGDGELKKALTIHAHKFSKSAEEKITKAGGKIEVIGGAAEAAAAKPAKPQAKAKADSAAKAEAKTEAKTQTKSKPEAKKEKAPKTEEK
jgi:large subunit ribosomal protein L15